MAERRESVRLELIDQGFSTKMAKNAVATGLLEKALKSLDGTSVNIHHSISESATQMDRLSTSSKNADGSINQLTGRLRVLGEVAAILGPALTPLGGVGIAGIGGLANQMGVAAVAGGVLIGSLQGVFDALGAMNDAQLDPTDKNLEKAEQALKRLSPAARDFAEAAFDLKPALVAIRDIGAEALMPGLTESLDNLERLGPRVAGIFQTVAATIGDVTANATESFASERWADFFAFIEREAPDTITELATTVGDLTHGLSELWEAFTPLNDGFSSWLMDAADGFDQWATGLSATEGFQEFVSYIQETGPQVADTLGALANAVVQIVQASAPLGGPVLAGLEAAADAIGAIADSDLGTPIMTAVGALALLNRSLAVTASLSKTSLGGGMFAGLGAASDGAKKGAGSIKSLSGDLSVLGTNFATAGAKSERMAAQNAKALDSLKQTGRAIGGPTALLGGLAIASTDVADGFGLTNTMSLGLMGTLAGPWGAAVGAGAGLLLDLKAANDQTAASFEAFEASLQSMSLDELNVKLRETNDLFSEANKVGETGGPKGETDAAKAIKAQIEVQKKAEEESRKAALAFLAQTGANVDLAEWSRKSAEDIKAQAQAIMDAQESANKTAASFINLGESLNDGKVSLGDWIKEMRDSAIALEQFTANSRKAAKRGLDDGLIESLQQAGEEGALRMKQLANGTDAAINQANAAFNRGEKAAKSYNDFKVPPKKLDVDPSAMQRKVEDAKARLDRLNAMKPTPKVDADTAAAQSKLNNLLALLREAERDRASTVTTTFVTNRVPGTGFGPVSEANGGVLDFYADGGVAENHVAQIAPAGSWRVWAEPETGGEAYIPLAPAKRERSIDIWEEVGSRLGVTFERFASGGTTDDDDEEKKKRRRRKFNGAAYTMDNTAGLQRSIDRLTLIAEDQTGAVEAQTRVAEEAAEETRRWAEKMSEVAQATTAGFNTGLFDKASNPWAAGAGGGAIGNLTKDIAGLNERNGLQQQLAGMGLSGDALAALLSEGTNADISGLINSGQVSQYADLFNQRAALQGSVGAAAGQQAYGAQYAAAERNAINQQQAADRANAELSQVNTQLTVATARLEAIEQRLAENPGEIGSVINGGAAKAQRGRNNRPRSGGRSR